MHHTNLSTHRSVIEDRWFGRLEKTWHRYQCAVAKAADLRELAAGFVPPANSDMDAALGGALAEVDSMHAEYTKILRVFTNLLVQGRLPREAGIHSGVSA